MVTEVDEKYQHFTKANAPVSFTMCEIPAGLSRTD